MDWPLLRAESGFQKIKARTEEANYFRDLHFVLVMKDEFPVNVVNLTVSVKPNPYLTILSCGLLALRSPSGGCKLG
jgi:hypothetical protein